MVPIHGYEVFFCNREYFFSYQMHPLSMKILYSSKKVKSSSSLKVFILYKLGQKVCNFGSPKIVWIILSPCLNIKYLFIVTIVMYIFIQKRSVVKHFSFRQYTRYSLKCISVNRKSTNIFIYLRKYFPSYSVHSFCVQCSCVDSINLPKIC